MSVLYSEYGEYSFGEYFAEKITAIAIDGSQGKPREEVLETRAGWEITKIERWPGDLFKITVERSRKDEDEQQE